MRDIRYRTLPDHEYERVVKRDPNISKGYENWCPTCDKVGMYTAIGGEVELCDCEMQVALYKWYVSSGIGKAYMRLTISDYQGDEEILSGITKYLDKIDGFIKSGMGLYLHGDVGVGKTFLANFVLKKLIKAGVTCFATTFANTIEMFTAGWGDRDDKEWFQQKFLRSQVLLLDDVGKELRNTKVALAETTFDSILRQRVTDGKPTIITTNLKVPDLAQGYGKAILSLIREQSLELEIVGVDYREQINDIRVEEVLNEWVRPIV